MVVVDSGEVAVTSSVHGGCSITLDRTVRYDFRHGHLYFN